MFRGPSRVFASLAACFRLHRPGGCRDLLVGLARKLRQLEIGLAALSWALGVARDNRVGWFCPVRACRRPSICLSRPLQRKGQGSRQAYFGPRFGCHYLVWEVVQEIVARHARCKRRPTGPPGFWGNRPFACGSLVNLNKRQENIIPAHTAPF